MCATLLHFVFGFNIIKPSLFTLYLKPGNHLPKCTILIWIRTIRTRNTCGF